jgi:sugar phosphate permease
MRAASISSMGMALLMYWRIRNTPRSVGGRRVVPDVF